jgi:hypothetical protein
LNVRTQEIQAQALSRAISGQSLTNYTAIYEGFAAKGIPSDQIQPRVNVLSFNAAFHISKNLYAMFTLANISP